MSPHHLFPETLVVGPMCPRETKEKEGCGRRPGINDAEKCRQSGPSTPNSETSTVRPSWQHKTGEEGGGERAWPEARMREREDEAGEAAKDETTAGAEDKIARD